MASRAWEKSDLERERHREDSEEGSRDGWGCSPVRRLEAGKSRVLTADDLCSPCRAGCETSASTGVWVSHRTADHGG